jgi:indole-3-glycerol phosphate synthase
MKILNEIIEATKRNVEKRKKASKINVLNNATNSSKEQAKYDKKSIFVSALQSAPFRPALIAEIKRSSPSHGPYSQSKPLTQTIEAYRSLGAVAISYVSNESHFGGSIQELREVVKVTTSTVQLPVLQKDFVIDPFQIMESGKAGVSALLLIARIVSTQELSEFMTLCRTQKIEPVVEVYSNDDLQKAIECAASVIAVNARDLDTFSIDISKSMQLLKQIPSTIVRLAFSGVHSVLDMQICRNAGADGMLIGTSLLDGTLSQKEFSSLSSQTVLA